MFCRKLEFKYFYKYYDVVIMKVFVQYAKFESHICTYTHIINLQRNWQLELYIFKTQYATLDKVPKL